MENCFIRAVDLTKSYGLTCALELPDLGLPAGQIIGLLGPNGSGKSTFIKLLAGILTPSSGHILIGGREPGRETKAVVSYLPERTYLNSSLRVEEYLTYFADFYEDFDRALAEKMLFDLKVEPSARIRTLSKGTREKVQLVLVMARRAQLYLLDEPIAGVDPAAREYILKTIISGYRREATVIISTHLLSDVEELLDRFIFVQNGRVLTEGDVETLHAGTGKTLDEYFREVFRCSASC